MRAQRSTTVVTQNVRKKQSKRSRCSRQGWQYGTVRWYGTVHLNFCKKYGTLGRYAFFVKVRVRYVGTIFELKIPDFSHIAPTFCIQRQKTAETDAKYMN